MILNKTASQEGDPNIEGLDLEYDEDTGILKAKVTGTPGFEKLSGIVTEVFSHILEKSGIPINEGIIEVELSPYNIQEVFVFEAELMEKTGVKVKVVDTSKPIIQPPKPVLQSPKPVLQPILQKPKLQMGGF